MDIFNSERCKFVVELAHDSDTSVTYRAIQSMRPGAALAADLAGVAARAVAKLAVSENMSFAEALASLSD